MSCKKVEVEVPDGYKLIQDGLDIKFVDQRGKWEDKDKFLIVPVRFPPIIKICKLLRQPRKSQ
jgi:hypothetical protein